MTDVERKVVGHYTQGGLADAIEAGLQKLQQASGTGLVDLLAGVDEFHIGGRSATKALAERLDIGADNVVLDVGCGLGGTARFLASTYGCRVCGCDLTPEYIRIGTDLNRQVGLSDRIDLVQASALAMPYEAGRFDRATMLHVGMNIADKAALIAEVARVIAPGGLFGVFDIMLENDAPMAYPVAWAADESTSLLASPDEYRAALETAGFEIIETLSMRDTALAFFDAIKVRLAASGPPPLGLHLVMGQDAGMKVVNMHANIAKGAIAPVQMIARRS